MINFRKFFQLPRRQNIIIGLLCLFCFWAGGFIAARVSDEKINIVMVQQAQKIFGLDFSDAEVDSMLDDLERRRRSYIALRKLALPNSVPPAFVFNPMPPAYRFPDHEDHFEISSPGPVSLGRDQDELAFYTIAQLAELIRTRQITSVKLSRYFIDRLKKYDPYLLYTISLTEERAMDQARKADKEIAEGKYRGILHGIPFGVKDLLATKDYKTTWGSVPYKDQHIDADATVITRLEEAGAVLIVKTTLGELAMGDVWFGGRTKNPWDIRRGSSGSSAGSASAVAAGCLPFAIGSETLGSIVSPSSECGVTGLRPTFGRVSKFGAMALSWSMDKLGPIARSAEDCAIVFNAIHGTDEKDPSTIAAPFNYSSPDKDDLKGVKIGYIASEFSRKYANSLNDSLSLEKLRDLGAELIPFELPDLPYNDIMLVLSAESGAAFEDLTLSDRDELMVNQDKNARPNGFRSAHFIPAIQYIQASRARTLLIGQLNSRMKKIDVFVAPSLGQNLRATNLSGHPCVVLPNGFTKNLPGSITFTGQLFGEGELLRIAQIFQNTTDFENRHPALNFW